VTTSAPATVVRIYDEIGGAWGIPAAALVAELDAARGDVEIRLSSPGGDVLAAIAVYSALRQRRGTVAVWVDGLAASAATVIAMAASPGRLTAGEGSLLMVHDAWAACAGNAADLLEMADLLDKASENIAGIYARRSGVPAAAWRTAMKRETWYTAEEAVAAGLVDRAA
jgi:ATP-dependent protease ClpP protease subunit